MSEPIVVETEAGPVRITSPDKVMFPERGWTKRDVVDHYLRVMPGALRGVYGRPCLLKRWPGGVGERPFYQKRAKGAITSETVRVRFPSARPGIMHVPRTDADVIRMVQMNCLDLNPWPVRAEDTDHPDELRIDLDPTPDVGFGAVREVAGAVQEELTRHGLVGWPKTSGSRGFHVYVRIAPEWTFEEVRRAVLALAREVERALPDLATTAWWKEERRGVFIDYNQNARDKTIASAYSVRHTGLVSTPFRWDELDDIDPWAYDLASFADRWAEVGDLTEGIDEAVGRLEPLLELVAAHEAEGLGDAPWPPHYPKQPGEPPRVAPSRRRKDAEDAG